MNEIIQAVRSCPSGALSYGIDHVEARIQVDQDREPWIEASKDGPYRVTGGGCVHLEVHGREREPPAGVDRQPSPWRAFERPKS
jgi:hypothetical protein